MKRLAVCVTLVATWACGSREPSDSNTPAVELSADMIREHTRTLSADDFLGRGPGQRGGDMAVEYISARFGEMGLEAVNGSYVQSIPMTGNAPDPASVRLTFRGPQGSETPVYLDDFVLNPGDPVADSVEGTAEIVFVGYGISAPETDWNDFEAVDVRGKVILVLVNDPPAGPDEPDLFGARAMTYYGRWTYKYEEAARQGALGALIVHETEPAGYPWSVVRGGFSGEQFSLPPDPAAPRPAGMIGWVTQEMATKLLALGGHDYEELKAAAALRGFEAVPTGVSATGALRSTVRTVETQNVVGLVRGSTAPDEVVTLTAHYDHFGVGEPVDGDSIYNGAYDNASGTALLLELARVFSSAPERPRRSILLIAAGAEEQGLLGAAWYVQSPLFPLNRTVAEINIDQANMWGETEDVIVQGEERSELGAIVRARAAELGLEIIPDAEPEKGFFFRSDHFPFAKAGIPSLFIEHGRRYRGQPEGWGQQMKDDYTANRYHAPSDEFSDTFVFDGAVQQGMLAYLVAMDLARSAAWPNWHEGQEFKAARDAMMGTP